MIKWLESHLITCQSKALTGIDCPGCGSQRALIALLKGDLPGSILLQPGLIPLIFTLIYTGLHIGFKFRHGARVILISYLLTAVLTFGQWIFRFVLAFDFGGM